MPSDKAHAIQAQSNIRFLESFIESYDFNDWAITVAFYTCVHIVEFLIFTKEDLKYAGKDIALKHSDQLPTIAGKLNIPPPKNLSWTAKLNHKFRNMLVGENFPKLREPYYRLYNASREARYYCYKWNKMQIDLVLTYSLTPMIKWANQNFTAGLKVTKKLLKS